MTDEARRVRSVLDGILGGADPIDPTKPMAGIVVHGGTVIIGNHNHVGVEPERISEAQSRLLKRLVGLVGKAERERNPAFHNARIWTKVNAAAGVDHHRDILKRDFDKAKDMLDEWLLELSAQET